MGVFGGCGGGGGGCNAQTPSTTTQIIRQAPDIEARQIALMDQAASAAGNPIYQNVQPIQVANLSQQESQGTQLAGMTGIGSQAVNAGIGSVLQGQQAAFNGPNISQFYNPYQSYVLDEINRQSAMAQNQLAGNAVQAGAFGGTRQGVQAAEQERARLGQVGQAQASGFNTALNAATQQQQLQAQTGLQAGQQLGNLGLQQQTMNQADINQLMTSGGLQRQLAQQALCAQRTTQLQTATDPLQRLEFLSNIYAAGPKSTSGITAATAPTTSPLSQAAGAGLGAYAAFGGLKAG
jgi:hypothetical protein